MRIFDALRPRTGARRLLEHTEKPRPVAKSLLDATLVASLLLVTGLLFWFIERRDAGEQEWSTVIAGPATLPTLAATELRPAGAFDVRATLACLGADPVFSAASAVRVAVEGAAPPVDVPDVPLPTPVPLPGGDPAAILEPAGVLPPGTDDTRVCVTALSDVLAVRELVARRRAAFRRRPTAARRRALTRARRLLAQARAAERDACS